MTDAKIDRSTTVRQNEEVVFAALADGESALMNLQSGNYFVLNAVGTSIWQMLEKPLRVAELCKKLAVKYEVDEPTCFSDTASYLLKMRDENLILAERHPIKVDLDDTATGSFGS